MDSAMLMNISDQQIDDALNDESEERVGKLNKAIKKLDAEERALISLFYNEEKTRVNCYGQCHVNEYIRPANRRCPE